MMKNMMKKKGVASIPELRALAIESDVRMIACQMTMDLFEYTLDDMIDGIETRRRRDLHRGRHAVRDQPVHLSRPIHDSREDGIIHGRPDTGRERA